MKTIRCFNSYHNGNDSRLNIHFTDGTQFSRRISAYDAVRIAKEGRACLEEMMSKYAAPQPKPRPVQMTPEEAHFWELHHMKQLGILDEEQMNEYNVLLNKTDF